MLDNQGKNKPNIAGLILAAGMSARAGNTNKLLHPFKDKPLVGHTAQALADSRVKSVLAVLGHEAKVLEKALLHHAVAISVNIDYQQGLSTSLVHGVSLLYDYDAIIVCLGDMPHITTDVINQLIEASLANPYKSFFIPVYQGKRGNPLLITYRRYDDILKLQGDVGVRSLLGEYPEETMEIVVNSEGVLLDYDTEHELTQLDRHVEGVDDELDNADGVFERHG